MLAQLRPLGGATVTMLQAFFRDASGPLPHDMPDEMLLSLALSFRRLEQDPGPVDEGHAHAAAAIFALVSVLLAQNGAASTSPQGLDIAQNTMFRCLRIYQNSLEREIVGRIVGFSDGEDRGRLLASLAAELRRERHG